MLEKRDRPLRDPFDDFLLEGVGNVETLNQADGIHPTAEGQVKVAENVWKVLQSVTAD